MQKKATDKKKRFAKDVLATKEDVITSTGGGEPIPKGEKWTDEKRDEDQPRTDDGKFGTYASVGKSTKYPQHAWRGTYEKGHPLNPEGKKLTEKEKERIWEKDVKETPDSGKQVEQHFAQKIKGGDKIKKGTKFAINGSIYIAAIDMSVDEFKDALRHYWGNGHFGAMDGAFVAKSGARSAAEEKAIDRSMGYQHPDGSPAADRIEVVTNEKGKEEIAKLSSKTMRAKARAAAKEYKERKKAGYPKYDLSRFVQKRALERTGVEGSEHYKPDSDASDKVVSERIGSLNGKELEAFLNAPRFMDDGKFTLSDLVSEASKKTGMTTGDVIGMMKSGDIKLSDLKKMRRGE